ncbi:MAG: hypothetical protein KAW12_04440 [Candidatus Aminicenantes bacterium]|nr:hypothetical protein [Candidatus Aminicenantes bacterium]
MIEKSHLRLDKGQIECPDNVMVEIYKNKKPQERIKIASDMWDSAWEQLHDMLRSMHPNWEKEKIRKEVIKRLTHENL